MKPAKTLQYISLAVLFVGIAVLGSGCLSESGHVEGTQTQNDENTVAAAQANITTDQLAAIVTTAERFTERFGTYTNQDNYQNFQNLKVYATTEMQTWLSTFARQQQSDLSSQSIAFYGITTKTLTAKILNARPDTLQILINTKRDEVTDQSDSSKVFYQNMLIEMRRVDDDWKVNSAQFQKT
jgi:hypothetical protein